VDLLALALLIPHWFKSPCDQAIDVSRIELPNFQWCTRVFFLGEGAKYAVMGVVIFEEVVLVDGVHLRQSGAWLLR
jgi:hypothetical protein